MDLRPSVSRLRRIMVVVHTPKALQKLSTITRVGVRYNFALISLDMASSSCLLTSRDDRSGSREVMIIRM